MEEDILLICCIWLQLIMIEKTMMIIMYDDRKLVNISMVQIFRFYRGLLTIMSY